MFDEDEDLEEYEGFLPLRARKKARCLTTETVRRSDLVYFVIVLFQALSVLGLTTIRQVRQ